MVVVAVRGWIAVRPESTRVTDRSTFVQVRSGECALQRRVLRPETIAECRRRVRVVRKADIRVAESYRLAVDADGDDEQRQRQDGEHRNTTVE